MKSYYEYLKACTECIDEIYSEKDYERVTSRFKDFDVDFDYYNPCDQDLERYVLDTLLENKFGNNIWVEYIEGDYVSIDWFGVQSVDVLNDIKKLLESLGYNFEDYEYQKERDDAYNKARDIICDMSTDELKEFIEKYGTGNK